jgi:hypothetical protein
VIWLRILRWLSSFLAVRQIRSNSGSLYLERFKVFGWMPGDKRRWPFSVYLHRFHRPDNEPSGVLHTHPWRWSFSLVLSGGYTEERLTWRRSEWPPWPAGHGWITRRIRPFRLNIFRSGAAHRIDELHGECWTLFVAGPKDSSWGFLVPRRGLVPWRECLGKE